MKRIIDKKYLEVFLLHTVINRGSLLLFLLMLSLSLLQYKHTYTSPFIYIISVYYFKKEDIYFFSQLLLPGQLFFINTQYRNNFSLMGNNCHITENNWPRMEKKCPRTLGH